MPLFFCACLDFRPPTWPSYFYQTPRCVTSWTSQGLQHLCFISYKTSPYANSITNQRSLHLWFTSPGHPKFYKIYAIKLDSSLHQIKLALFFTTIYQLIDLFPPIHNALEEALHCCYRNRSHLYIDPVNFLFLTMTLLERLCKPLDRHHYFVPKNLCIWHVLWCYPSLAWGLYSSMCSRPLFFPRTCIMNSTHGSSDAPIAIIPHKFVLNSWRSYNSLGMLHLFQEHSKAWNKLHASL